MKIKVDDLGKSMDAIALIQKKSIVLKDILSGRSKDLVIPDEQLPNGGRMYYHNNIDFSKLNVLTVDIEKNCRELSDLVLTLINKINTLEREATNMQITGEQDQNIKEHMNARAKVIQDEYSKKKTEAIRNNYGSLRHQNYSTYTHEKVSFYATAAESFGNVAVGVVKLPTGLVTGAVDVITDKAPLIPGTNLKEKSIENLEALADETYRSYFRKHGAVNMDDYKNIQEFTGACLWVPMYAKTIGLDVSIGDINIEFATEKVVTILEHADKLGNVVDSDKFDMDIFGYAADGMKVVEATKNGPTVVFPK